MSIEADIKVVVFGEAQPAGSKRAFVHPHTGKTIVTDANAKSRPWKNRVAQAAGEQHRGGILDGPVILEVTFYEARTKGHYGTGRNAGVVKDSAPMYPAKKPDATKLLRGVEDALTGIVWRDDAQVVEQFVSKRYGDPARAEIVVRPADFATVGEFRESRQLALAA